MTRTIIKIDSQRCVGCGLCVQACHEGAIALINGKATLLRDDYCDGLGNCLPVCPTDALSFEQREAPAYNHAVAPKRVAASLHPPASSADLHPCATSLPSTMLTHWPIQIKLVPDHAPYFENAHLLVAADCTAFSYLHFHSTYMKNKVTIIGCPKLDEGDYTEKLTHILTNNTIQSVTVARMNVPCCGGIERAVKNALENCKKIFSRPIDPICEVITISTDGKILT